MPGKRRDASRRFRTVLVDLAASQIALVIGLLGVVALYISATSEGRHGPSTWDSVLREGGALLFVTAAITVAWDLRGRRQLTNEVLAAANLSEDITETGLTRITTHYSEIEWDELLNTASHVDFFFAYAATWRAYHDAALRRLVKREGARVRVILPDPEDGAQVAQLAARFGTSQDQIVQKVKEADDAFAGLWRDRHAKASVELRVTGAFPVFTYYRFDGRCIGVLYSQAGERVEVPAFECRHGGTLHKFFSDQFMALWRAGSARSWE
jgi:hypothetical protein